MVRGVTGQHQAALSPAFGHHRVEGVDHGAFDVGLAWRDPFAHQFPQCFGLDHLLWLITGHEHDFPSATVAGHVAIRHGACRVAVLHRVVGQAGNIGFESHIEHQPGLVQAQIAHAGAQHFAHQGAGAVAADHVAGLQGMAFLCLKVGHLQCGGVSTVFDGGDFVAGAHLHLRVAL